jgi:metal-responsive CopG/Arc/MetJ family transcriptional regulator
MSNRLSKRQRESVRLIAVKLPASLADELDRVVEATDSDRSKFTRTALRERMAKLGRGGAQ